ncbi:hypothetical protein F5I97DRAFT_2003561 [Phlebopus sp. FC_14]|nr:hypothetical protein F5I97DRAFT_2003561 [Phlebopus sp. FC_14]
MGSDDDAGFGVGRRAASSSSREPSPAVKRHNRSFSPTSDDGDLVIPAVPDDDAETPPPENAPIIRQAVGFSWAPSGAASISTYQATLPAQPTAPYFLPGQAPIPPPKPPKPTKPRATRKKKNEAYSAQTGRFRLTAAATELQPVASPSPAPSHYSPFGGMSGLATSPGATISSGSSTIGAMSAVQPTPGASFPPNYSSVSPMTGNVVSGPSGSNTMQTGMPAATKVPKQSKNHSSKGQRRARDSGRDMDRAAPQTSHYRRDYDADKHPMAGATTSSASLNTTSLGQTTSTATTQGSASRPLRMLTLLIEDMRSGVPDSQLAEVKVPLRVADDPEDGFWADAVDVCNALQQGPSRIDGPAKVYTMRGRFRQFFMRVDHHDQMQVQSAHLGVSKQRTLEVFVEAPVPQGHLPRPPAQPQDMRAYNSGSDSEALMSPTESRPHIYPTITREDQIERLSKINFVPQKRKLSPVSESGSYGRHRGMPSASVSQASSSPRFSQHKSRHRRRSPSSPHGIRSLSSPIPGRLADTQEEKDEAIVNYVRPHVENHPQWIQYIQSKAKSQRVSEVLKQYHFVEDRVRELAGQKTPAHWDGAPNCTVVKEHVWKVLKVDIKWGENCQETLSLVEFYGKNGTRYEDSRVIRMIEDTAPPKPKAMERFVRLLKNIDDDYVREAMGGREVPIPDSED